MSRGMICLTFDDGDLQGWPAALPLFEKAGAHVLFSFSGEVTAEVISCMRLLQDAGHSIGLHTVHHADAPEYILEHGAQAYFDDEIAPQLKPCLDAGIVPKSFAFPNNKFNDAAMALLKPYFDRFRVGYGDVGPLAATLTRDELPKTRLMRGIGIGELYRTKLDRLFALMDKNAENDTCTTFFSHSIYPKATFVSMPTEWLEAILEHGKEIGTSFVGFDELPALKD